jgi:hypothetical protein
VVAPPTAGPFSSTLTHSPMDELVGFLRHANAKVRQAACTHAHQLTASSDGLAVLKNERAVVGALARLTGDVQPIAQPALSALINLTAVPELLEAFDSCGLVGRLAENLQQDGYALMQLDIILLANLTAQSERIVNELLAAKGGATLLMLASALKDDVVGEHESLDCVTNIITHVAQYQVRFAAGRVSCCSVRGSRVWGGQGWRHQGSSPVGLACQLLRSRPTACDLQAGREFLQNRQPGLVKGLLEQIYSLEKLRRRGMLLFLSNLLCVLLGRWVADLAPHVQVLLKYRVRCKSSADVAAGPNR